MNSWANLNGKFPDSVFKSSVSMQIKFSTLLVGEEAEAYVYDFGNFMVALGGNLGLMLGFSCLTVIFSLIKFLFNCPI